MLEQLLAGAKDRIVQELTGKLGLNPEQAGQFFNKGVSLVEGALSGGAISPATLQEGSASGVVSRLDVGPLTPLVGGDAAKARSGMESILKPLMNAIKTSGGAESLLGRLGGAGRQSAVVTGVAGLAGKMFGKS